MATINDVAKKVGVSSMTVSRAINNSGYVKEVTRKKINKAIKELDFRPNMIAKSLATKRSHVIAFVLVNILDPFHNLMSQGIESICYNSGYVVMMCDTHSPRRELDYINMFQDRCVDGAIFHHLALAGDKIKTLENNGVKCILIDNEDEIPDVLSVDTDNYTGGFMAAEHLVERGHSSIGCLMGTLQPRQGDNIPYEDTFQFSMWHQRTDGFKVGLDKHGIKKRFFFQGNALFDEAKVCVKQTLDQIESMAKKPTAIYCENDMMAIAMLNDMYERGMKAPDDLAIIGHDGIDFSRMLHPYITTISQPRYEIGQLAAQKLIERINGNEKIEKAVLKPVLIQGETT